MRLTDMQDEERGIVMNRISGKCQHPECPSLSDIPGLGLCRAHATAFMPGLAAGNAQDAASAYGVELWNLNQDAFAYGVAWVVIDRPEQPTNVRVVDFGVYRTPLPDAEAGTIQETAQPRCMVRFEGHPGSSHAEALVQAFRTAFMFIHNDVRFTLAREFPTFKKQLRQAVKEAIEETAPLKGVTP